MSDSRPFRAKYPGGFCGECGQRTYLGAWLRYVDNIPVHLRCDDTPRVDDSESFEAPKERQFGPVVIGRREHGRRCESCFLTHAGECL